MEKDIAYFLVLLVLPLERYMALVFTGKRTFVSFIIRPLESGLYRLCRIDEKVEMSWKQYSLAFLLFNGIGLVILFLLQLVQGRLPLNPVGLGPVRRDTALNTAYRS